VGRSRGRLVQCGAGTSSSARALFAISGWRPTEYWVAGIGVDGPGTTLRGQLPPGRTERAAVSSRATPPARSSRWLVPRRADSYQVFRDQILITTSRAPVLSYEDAPPSGRHAYAVRAGTSADGPTPRRLGQGRSAARAGGRLAASDTAAGSFWSFSDGPLGTTVFSATGRDRGSPAGTVSYPDGRWRRRTRLLACGRTACGDVASAEDVGNWSQLPLAPSDVAASSILWQRLRLWTYRRDRIDDSFLVYMRVGGGGWVAWGASSRPGAGYGFGRRGSGALRYQVGRGTTAAPRPKPTGHERRALDHDSGGLHLYKATPSVAHRSPERIGGRGHHVVRDGARSRRLQPSR
jgi:hypothetical protein